MKTRRRTSRTANDSKPDLEAMDSLVESSGDDPEVAQPITQPITQPVAQPVAQPKAKRKLGKSHPDNSDYTKTMLYLQADLAEEVNRRAFESKKYDRTDIVNQAIAAFLGSGFEFKEP